jgi:AcrR family transcriptional regulator
MIPAEHGLKQKIIDTAKAMLDEGVDVEKITVRQIAERAGVGIGLINYHFKSKDNLLSIAIGDVMEQIIMKFTGVDAGLNMAPDVRLRMLLKELCASAGSDEKVVRFMMLREITEGHMQAPLYLIPILREMLGEGMDDMQLRIIALQILQPLQLSALNPAAFHMYSGIDISDLKQRNRFIDALIDNLVASKGNPEGR